MVILASSVPLTLLNLLAIRSISTGWVVAQVIRSSAPHQIVLLGSASRCPYLVVVSAGCSTPGFDESLTPTDAPYPYLKTGLVTVILFQRFMDRTFLLWSCANRLHSLSAAFVPVCPVGGAHRYGVLRSSGRFRFGGFLGGLLRSVQAQAPLLSATVAAVGTPFRSPIPLPKRAPRRVSFTAPLRCQE